MRCCSCRYECLRSLAGHLPVGSSGSVRRSSPGPGARAVPGRLPAPAAEPGRGQPQHVLREDGARRAVAGRLPAPACGSTAGPPAPPAPAAEGKGGRGGCRSGCSRLNGATCALNRTSDCIARQHPPATPDGPPDARSQRRLLPPPPLAHRLRGCLPGSQCESTAELARQCRPPPQAGPPAPPPPAPPPNPGAGTHRRRCRPPSRHAAAGRPRTAPPRPSGRTCSCRTALL